MSEFYDEEQVLKNRIILRESTIRKLTSKYLDLISKFNTLTRNEMAQLIREILNEIDMIEIAILKAENLQKLKLIDTQHHNKLAIEIGKNIMVIHFCLDDNVRSINSDILDCNKKLIEAKREKEYKINCEEVAKIINGYESKECLEENIMKLEEENQVIENTDKLIMEKLNVKSGKLSLLLKLIDDLKSNLEDDMESLNKLNKNNNKLKIDS